MRDVWPFVKAFIDKRYHLSAFDDHDALSLPAVSVDYAQSIGPNAADRPVLQRLVLKTANLRHICASMMSERPTCKLDEGVKRLIAGRKPPSNTFNLATALSLDQLVLA